MNLVLISIIFRFGDGRLRDYWDFLGQNHKFSVRIA